MESKHDRRVRYTKMVLRQALLALMQEASIDKITVTDICRQADINRGTFYTHYTDQYDLLHQIEEELQTDILASLQRYDRDQAGSPAYHIISEILECIAQQSDLCRILLGKYGDTDFLKRILQTTQDQFLSLWAQNGGNPALHAYVYAFVANGCIGVIQSWIQTDMKETPTEMAHIINTLFNGGSVSLLN